MSPIMTYPLLDDEIWAYRMFMMPQGGSRHRGSSVVLQPFLQSCPLICVPISSDDWINHEDLQAVMHIRCQT